MQKNELAEYLFHQGTNFEAYRYLGSKKQEDAGGLPGVFFRVFAPNAKSVSVVGGFNQWDNQRHMMTRVSKAGIYELFIRGVQEGAVYKYCITTDYNHMLYKADPYAFAAEENRGTGSVVADIGGFEWTDQKWQSNKISGWQDKPCNIYECHIGSWRKNADGSEYSYRQFAKEIIPYLIETGFTHLELMGIAEYPFDGSWGYQVTGYFAPTNRYGKPHDLMYLVNECHKAGIAVILDWVPGHFPKDAHGLCEFDGHPLYEPADPLRMEHKEWGTRCFDYGRTEVQSFLISNACYWLAEYHIDGLRVDAVASMLYLDYNRKSGEWRPNSYGGNGNLDAMAFLKKLNSAVEERHKGCMMIAEESTAWPKVSHKVEEDGLGFGYKWNMGWMNDVLRYVKTEPFFRKHVHHNLTFSLMYAFSEKFILPISHDEVVHGKGSLLNKMPGEYEMKFAGLRAFMGYMMTHPGKKLLFMGSEIGQFDEWDYKKPLEWELLEYPMHKKTKSFFNALNRLYIDTPALWENDFDWKGFEWIVADDNEQNILVYRRIDRRGQETVAIINFSPVRRDEYRFGVNAGRYKEIFSSDAADFGGGGTTNPSPILSEKIASHGKDDSIAVTIPPMSFVLLSRSKTRAAAKTDKTKEKKAASK